MPKVCENADLEAYELLADTIEEYEPDLKNHNVTIGLMMVSSDKPHPLKLHGSPCYAIVKINSYEDRVEGKPDATIRFDATAWASNTEDRNIAILHHEIHHLIIKMKDGGVHTDDLGRPKLKMRPHDFEVGWFKIVAETHGDSSVEVRQANILADNRGQLMFPWTRATEDGQFVTGVEQTVKAALKPRLAATTATA